MPIDDGAERAVLASCLRSPAAFSDVAAIIAPSDFRIFAHQRIFEAIANLHAKGEPISPVTVFDWLINNGLADDVKSDYLCGLWDAYGGHPIHEANIVKTDALIRDLGLACREIQAEIFSPSMPQTEILDMAERRILEINQKRVSRMQTVPVAEVINETADRLEARVIATKEGHHAATGISTGYYDLDFLTGGYQDQELVIIGARPSVGKTALGLNSFYHALGSGVKALFFSLEQGRLELGDRFLCMDALVDSHKVRCGMLNGYDQEAVVKSCAKFQAFQSWINDTSNLTIAQIANECRRYKVKYGLQLVFIDYLQFIVSDDRKVPRHEQVAEISRRLKSLARELKIPIVVMTQLNRQIEGQSRQPRLSDLKESGQIEQDADTVILLHNPQQNEQGETGEKKNGPIDLIVAKQRNGPIGVAQLFFQRAYYRFENLTS